jgi:hypothetical protein
MTDNEPTPALWPTAHQAFLAGQSPAIPGVVDDSDALDVDAIAEKWLRQCGPFDGGLAMGCTHPAEDYRPTMAALVGEVERLRALISPPAPASEQP